MRALIRGACIHVLKGKHLLVAMANNNGTNLVPEDEDDGSNSFKPDFGVLAVIAFALAILALVFLVFSS